MEIWEDHYKPIRLELRRAKRKIRLYKIFCRMDSIPLQKAKTQLKIAEVKLKLLFDYSSGIMIENVVSEVLTGKPKYPDCDTFEKYVHNLTVAHEATKAFIEVAKELTVDIGMTPKIEINIHKSPEDFLIP